MKALRRKQMAKIKIKADTRVFAEIGILAMLVELQDDGMAGTVRMMMGTIRKRMKLAVFLAHCQEHRILRGVGWVLWHMS